MRWTIIGSSGGGGGATYTNATPTPTDVGGIPAGSTFVAVPYDDMWTDLLYEYVPPSITLSQPAAAVIEFPLLEPSITIEATSVRHTDPITLEDLQVSLNGGAYATVYNQAVINPAGELYSTSWSPSDDFAWPLVQVNQVSTLDFRGRAGDGTTTTASNVRRQTYVYPFYYGVGAPGLLPAQIAALTKLVAVQSDKVLAFNPVVQVYYFAYPNEYPALTRILDGNGFDITADWTPTVISITGADGTAQDYKQYEFKNINSTAQNLTFDF